MKLHRILLYAAKLLILFALYFITAQFGLMIEAVSGFATLVWPPTGIALAALLIFGYPLWLAVALGAFLINLLRGAPLLVACGIGAGNTLEAIVGVYLLQRVAGFQKSLDRLQDVLSFILFAALLSTTISATMGVSSLWAGGVISWPGYAPTWAAWWLGDILGNLIIAPLLLTWWGAWRLKELQFAKVVEGGALALTAVAVGWLIFGGLLTAEAGNSPIAYLIFPPIIWAALRFGQRGTVTATFGMSILAIWGTAAGFGPFVRERLSESLFFLQIFMGVVSVTALILAAVVMERQRSEEALLKERKQLEQYSRDLQEANEILKKLSESKSNFIALAAHELITPLTSIGGFLAVILQGKTGALTDKQKEYLTLIKEVSDQLLEVVNDLLDITRIELGQIKMKLERTELKNLLDEIVMTFKMQVGKKNIALKEEVEEPLKPVVCDPNRIKEVLNNLVSNAIKYTPRKGKIWIRAKNVPEAVEIDIEDTGIGIKKENYQKIFEPFQHIRKSGLQGEKSAGLGLALVKKIVEAHGGRIGIQSQVGHGSTFSVILPEKPGGVP